jgi:lysozyme
MMPLREWIMHHAKFNHKIHLDHYGNHHVGYGRNLDVTGISREEGEFLLDNDIKRCNRGLEIYPWFMSQPYDVKDALVHMCYSVTLPKMLGFKKMITALQGNDYVMAAIEVLDSNWAEQNPVLAKDIALVIRGGRG